jgi:hypothetical protein
MSERPRYTRRSERSPKRSEELSAQVPQAGRGAGLLKAPLLYIRLQVVDFLHTMFDLQLCTPRFRKNIALETIDYK